LCWYLFFKIYLAFIHPDEENFNNIESYQFRSSIFGKAKTNEIINLETVNNITENSSIENKSPIFKGENSIEENDNNNLLKNNNNKINNFNNETNDETNKEKDDKEKINKERKKKLKTKKEKTNKDNCHSEDNEINNLKENIKTNIKEKENESIKKTKYIKNCCNCTKSNCQKKYCDCYSNNRYCESCSCTDCYNQEKYAIQRKANNQEESSVDSAVAVELTCTCTKSSCQKKYCECFKNGDKCKDTCRCLNCLNRDYSSLLINKPFGIVPRIEYKMECTSVYIYNSNILIKTRKVDELFIIDEKLLKNRNITPKLTNRKRPRVFENTSSTIHSSSGKRDKFLITNFPKQKNDD
jgi:hypothetical protein